MNYSRAYSTAVFLPAASAVIVAGGRTFKASPGHYQTATESFSATDKMWKTVADMHVCREQHASVAISPSQLIVIGGTTSADCKDTSPRYTLNTVELYDATTNKVCIYLWTELKCNGHHFIISSFHHIPYPPHHPPTLPTSFPSPSGPTPPSATYPSPGAAPQPVFSKARYIW
jgi:hypothetical protein